MLSLMSYRTWKAGPASCLGSTVGLDLVKEVGMSQSKGKDHQKSGSSTHLTLRIMGTGVMPFLPSPPTSSSSHGAGPESMRAKELALLPHWL